MKTLQIFQKKYNNLKFIHNPEFLSSKTAFKDFKNQKQIILGRTNIHNIQSVTNFYRIHFPDSKITIVDSKESELTKLAANSFYAVKIQFFNEIYLACKSLGINYNIIKKSIVDNGWVNPMHTEVPGSDGKLSFGGMCLPKDIEGLGNFFELNKIPNDLLNTTLRERKLLRNVKVDKH